METNNINKINLFFRLSLESCEDENDFIYEDLGVSKEEFLNNKIKMINKLKLKSIAIINKENNENKFRIAIEKIKKILNSPSDKLKFEQLILNQSPTFQFRNLEKLDENDMKELLDDVNILNIIDQLEKEQ